jgi:hypothetical protein
MVGVSDKMSDQCVPMKPAPPVTMIFMHQSIWLALSEAQQRLSSPRLGARLASERGATLLSHGKRGKG